MSAQERRVVHEHLKDRAGVETYSEGDEPHRCVVVAPLVSRVSADPPPPRSTRADAAALETVLELLADERASVSSVTEPDRAWQVHVDDSLTGLEVEDLRERRADRRHRLWSWVSGPRPRRRAARRAGRPDRVGRPQVRVHPRARSSAAGIANAEVVNARSEELARRRRAARPTTRSPPAPSAGSRPSPSSPRRCCARAASWSPGRASATRRRRRELERAAAALAMEPERDPRRRPLRRQPPPPPPRAPQESAPTPAGPPRAARAWRRSARRRS